MGNSSVCFSDRLGGLQTQHPFFPFHNGTFLHFFYTYFGGEAKLWVTLWQPPWQRKADAALTYTKELPPQQHPVAIPGDKPTPTGNKLQSDCEC